MLAKNKFLLWVQKSIMHITWRKQKIFLITFNFPLNAYQYTRYKCLNLTLKVLFGLIMKESILVILTLIPIRNLQHWRQEDWTQTQRELEGSRAGHCTTSPLRSVVREADPTHCAVALIWNTKKLHAITLIIWYTVL